MALINDIISVIQFLIGLWFLFSFLVVGVIILLVLVAHWEAVSGFIFLLVSVANFIFKRLLHITCFFQWSYICKNLEAADQIRIRLSLTRDEVGFLMDFRSQRAVREAFEEREGIERDLREAAQRKEQERREKLRKKPRPVKPRRFKDPAVTRLYMMFQDSFPLGGGFTCNGQWVDEELAAKAREVLEPCFSGEPALKPLSTKIVKLIHADAGDARLTVEERTSMFQLFYEPNIQTRKSTARQEESICL